jgi:membrane protease YdiL (CAAX protease family)
MWEAGVPLDRLTRSEKRALLLWVIAGVLGAWFAQKYFFRAFPEASVNFKVSRDEALSRAQGFVGSLGENVSGYQTAIVFSLDDNAKTYLERELGLQQANQLMSTQLNIWFWDVRFFKPQQEEEFRVRVSPAGNIIGYARTVPKAMAGRELDRAAALTVAQSLLSGPLAVDLKNWDYLPEEANSEKQPNRLDWRFTWEKHAFRAKDAPYRLKVSVQGDRIGGAQESLQVPAAWERSFKQLRSSNDFLTSVTIVPYVLLLAAALWMGINLTRRGQANWVAAVKIGAVVAVALFCMQLNEWPVARASYDTNVAYGSFVLQQIAIAILFGLGSAITITMVLPAGEALYRVSQPDKLQLGKAFSLRGVRSKEFFSSVVVGLSMTGLSLGFVVAFYMIGSRYGVWAPQELNYSNSVSTSFPWISGVAIGLLAATNEEFTFRLFAIPFLQRLTGSSWLAVIIPAFCWSFLHTNYPQEPPYIRGLEVGIMGIATGLVMLRWGIIATLVWHYTFDASQVGLLLIRSNSLYFKISGIVVGAAALAPLAFAGISYLARGGFEADEDLLNGAMPAPDTSFTRVPARLEPAPAARRYEPLTVAMTGFLAACVVAGSVLTWKLEPPSVGDYLKLSVDARTARARADEILRARGLDPNSFYHATVLLERTDPVTNEFLRERIGIKALNDVYDKQVPGALWRVRYFRDRQPEEYAVILKPDGSLYSIHHALAEDTPGASLSKDEAVTKATSFLREQKKIDLSQWSLVGSESNKRPHRIDHLLTWQRKTALDAASTPSGDSADHAYARIELQVLGDEVVDYHTYIQIPDDWRRKQSEETLFRTILGYAALGLSIGALLTTLILFLKRMRTDAARAVPWRRLSLLALWGLAAFLLVFALGNQIPNALSQYQTAIPFKLMLGGIAVGVLLGGPFVFGALAVLFGLAWYYSSRAFGEERLPSVTGMPAAYYRDALWIGLAGAIGFTGLHQLLDVLFAHWPTMHRSFESSFGGDFDAILPAASLLGGTLLRSLFSVGLIALIASFITVEVRQRWLRYLLFLLGALILAGSSWGTPADFAKQLLTQTIALFVIVFGVQRIMRVNILGGFLLLALTSLLGGAMEFLSQPDSFYRANGYASLLFAVSLLAWPLVAGRKATEHPVSA